jgi:general secretion pathway protein D
VSSIVKQISVPIGNGGTTLAYEIGTRNASTLLELKDGETQVLAGLIQDSDRRSSAQVPVLGDLPILGRLFGSRGTARDKNEIVLSITPRLIRTRPRPSSETTEFWYGSESQTRSGPFAGGAAATQVSGAGPVVPGGVSFGAGGGNAPPAPSGPRPVPERIGSAAGPPPPPPPPPPAEGAAADTNAGAQGAADSRPKVTIEGPDTAKVGDEISVSVRLASIVALGRVRTQVGFDAAALQLVSAEPGDLAPSGEAPKVQTKPGGVQVELAGSEGAPISGGGSLIDLRFRVVQVRPAVSILTQVVLIGEDGVAVAATQATPLKIAVTK